MENIWNTYCMRMIYIHITYRHTWHTHHISDIPISGNNIQSTCQLPTDYIQITCLSHTYYISFTWKTYTTYTTYTASGTIQCTMIQWFNVGIYLFVAHFRAHVLMYHHLQPSVASSFESLDAPGKSLASFFMQYGTVPVVPTGTTGNLPRIEVTGTT